MKKILTLTLVLIIILTGCGSNNDPQDAILEFANGFTDKDNVITLTTTGTGVFDPEKGKTLDSEVYIQEKFRMSDNTYEFLYKDEFEIVKYGFKDGEVNYNDSDINDSELNTNITNFFANSEDNPLEYILDYSAKDFNEIFDDPDNYTIEGDYFVYHDENSFDNSIYYINKNGKEIIIEYQFETTYYSSLDDQTITRRLTATY